MMPLINPAKNFDLLLVLYTSQFCLNSNLISRTKYQSLGLKLLNARSSFFSYKPKHMLHCYIESDLELDT